MSARNIYIDDIKVPVPQDVKFPGSNGVHIQPIPFSSNPNVFSTGVSEHRIELTIQFHGSGIYDTIEQLRGRIENQAFNVVNGFGTKLHGNHEVLLVAFEDFSPEYPPGKPNLAKVSLSGAVVGFPESHQFGYYFAWKQRTTTSSTLGSQTRMVPGFGTFNHSESSTSNSFPTNSFGGELVGLEEFDLASVQSDVTSYTVGSVSRQGIFFDSEPDYLHVPAWRIYDDDKNLITTTRVFNKGKLYLSFGPAFNKNRVPNPTLTIDSDSDGILDGFTHTGDTGGTTITGEIQDHKVPNTGNLPRSDKSFFFKTENPGGGGASPQARTFVPVKHSTTYTCSVYNEVISAPSDSQVRLQVREFDSSGTSGTINQVNASSAVNNRMELTFTTDATTSYVRVLVWHQTQDGETVESYWYGLQLEQSSSATTFDHIGWPFDYGYIFDLESDKVHVVLDREDWELDDSNYNGRPDWEFSMGSLKPIRCRVNNLDQINLSTKDSIEIDIKRGAMARFFFADKLTSDEVVFDVPTDVVEDGTTTAPDHTLWLKDTNTSGNTESLRLQSNFELAFDNANDKFSNNEGTEASWWVTFWFSGWGPSDTRWYPRAFKNSYDEFV